MNHFSTVFKGKHLVGLKRSPTKIGKTIIKCYLFRNIKITMIRKEVPLWKCQVKRSMPFFTKVSPSSVERKPAILNTGRNGIFAVENPTKNYTSQLTSLWITRARAPRSKMTDFKFVFTSASVTSSQSFHTRFISFKFSDPRNIRISTGCSLM